MPSRRYDRRVTEVTAEPLAKPQKVFHVAVVDICGELHLKRDNTAIGASGYKVDFAIAPMSAKVPSSRSPRSR